MLSVRDQLDALKSHDSVVQEKRAQLDRILQECLGLSVETTVDQPDVVPGETLKVHHTVTNRSEVSVKCVAVRYSQLKKEEKKVIELKENAASSWESSELVPAKTHLTQPWWLRKEGTAGLFLAEDANLIGSAENAAPFPVEYVFEVAGKTLVVGDEPTSVSSDSSGKEVRRRLDVIPPVSLSFASTVALLRPAASRSLEVQVTAARANVSGNLKLEAPSGWKVTPAKAAFQLKNIREKQQLKFTITAPKDAASAKVVACAEVNGVPYRNQRVEINYPHIPVQLLQPEATMRCVSMDLQTRGHKIGYLPGAGDSLPENIQEMGYTMEELDETGLTAERLAALDAMVLGVRAFNVREKIGTAMPLLFEYVKNGGTVIVQYNRPDKLKAEKIAPYDLHISSDRVTDEKAAMTFLAPEHPVLNKPNKITNSDFDGWIQERGIYFPDKWDEHFTPLLACNDAGEAPTKGALLVAPYGKGYYIYTGLVFFRELPAGVPGAYRLFANMLSINK